MDIVLDGKFIHTIPLDVFRTLPLPIGWHLAGFSFYLASQSNPKMPGRVWVDDALGLGYSLVSNWELTGNEWSQGYAAGLRHGADARARARERGVPDDSPIIQSGMDTNVPVSGYQTAFEYQQGFNNGSSTGPQGAYGPGYMISLMAGQRLTSVGWQWKDGSTPSVAAANMRQTYLQPWGSTIAGVGYDVNIALKPYWGQFSNIAPIPPIPPGEDEDMFSLVQHNGGTVYRVPSNESCKIPVTTLQAIACDFDILKLNGRHGEIVQLVDSPEHDWAAWLNSIPTVS